MHKGFKVFVDGVEVKHVIGIKTDIEVGDLKFINITFRVDLDKHSVEFKPNSNGEY